MSEILLANFEISEYDEAQQNFTTGGSQVPGGTHFGALTLLKPYGGFEFLSVVRTSIYVWSGSPRKEGRGVFLTTTQDPDGDPNKFVIYFAFTGDDLEGGGMGGKFTAAFFRG